ncbi:alpha/beta hydrolase [Pseudonocardia abyssalis]|uniref:Alpha/beta fold hydrolase n=1 Tax=Pseudonocardia abyssalis TaxID=2792008 RepID=A0ABS6UKM7_9PSEU|nr:alpha/beta fold hydrolase [Pseudonocardia abyssalis]MBW0118325.1 alpha/beta fold hydrolase [Pseudonocardia abyssalis]MBW0132783.1 alpha/beta fold hydrolase [Pseudonocardia abyssalis]
MITTFVLVHGAFCNAAAWSPLVRELTLRGHRALAVDLPGHGPTARIPDGGSALAGVGTADDVAAVTPVVERAARNGPVVLVGTSRGGLTVTAVANARPDLLARAVYVSAWCCTAPRASYEGVGESLLDPLVGGLLAADPVALGALRVAWPTAGATFDGLHRALLADGTPDELRGYLATMDTDESLHIDEDAVRLGAGAAVPRTFVRLTEDRALPPALQDRFVADADAAFPDHPFDVHDLRSSHIGFQLRPDGLADLLTGA